MITEHKQVNLLNPESNEEIGIDENLVHLMSHLWYEFDIRTNLSCQNSNGDTWIGFPSFEELERFLDILIIGRNEDEEMYDKIMAEWKYDVVLDDLAQKEYKDKDDYSWDNPSQIVFNVSVRFPRHDLDRVVEKFENTRLVDA